MNRTQGFTLIELMIVIAIIGVLTTVAVPMYQDYTVRSKVAASMSAINSIKFVVAEKFVHDGKYPEAGNANYGLPTKEDYADNHIASIALEAAGVIKVTYKKIGQHFGASDSVSFTPNIKGSMLRWECMISSTDIHPYFPNNCKTEVANIETPEETETADID